jgi:hypothetical protein
MSGRKICIAVAFGLLLLIGTASKASAQAMPPSPNPSRDQSLGTLSSITMAAAGVTELVMPRLFYSDPEVTQGWKARWHVSQLAPVLTLTTLTFVNEYALKDALKDPRPGCDDTNQGILNCATYGGLSTHAFGSGSFLGMGTAVWLFDMTKWSGGRFNGGSFAGNVAVPGILTAITWIGRGAGNFESTAQILEGGLAGLAFGFLTGMTYSLMARPECGYTGSLFCW